MSCESVSVSAKGPRPLPRTSAVLGNALPGMARVTAATPFSITSFAIWPARSYFAAGDNRFRPARQICTLERQFIGTFDVRAIVGVLDSFGLGAAPDAEKFGDAGANTFGHIAKACA